MATDIPTRPAPGADFPGNGEPPPRFLGTLACTTYSTNVPVTTNTWCSSWTLTAQTAAVR